MIAFFLPESVKFDLTGDSHVVIWLQELGL